MYMTTTRRQVGSHQWIKPYLINCSCGKDAACTCEVEASVAGNTAPFVGLRYDDGTAGFSGMDVRADPRLQETRVCCIRVSILMRCDVVCKDEWKFVWVPSMYTCAAVAWSRTHKENISVGNFTSNQASTNRGEVCLICLVGDNDWFSSLHVKLISRGLKSEIFPVLCEVRT